MSDFITIMYLNYNKPYQNRLIFAKWSKKCSVFPKKFWKSRFPCEHCTVEWHVIYDTRKNRIAALAKKILRYSVSNRHVNISSFIQNKSYSQVIFPHLALPFQLYAQTLFTVIWIILVCLLFCGNLATALLSKNIKLCVCFSLKWLEFSSIILIMLLVLWDYSDDNING